MEGWPAIGDAGAEVGVWQRRTEQTLALTEEIEAGLRSATADAPARAASLARLGVEWAKLHASLSNCDLSTLKLFRDRERGFLDSTGPTLIDRVEKLEDSMRSRFRRQKTVELEATERLAIRYSSQGVALANALRLDAREVRAARRVLRYLRRALGDERLTQSLSTVLDPTDPAGSRTLAPLLDTLTSRALER